MLAAGKVEEQIARMQAAFPASAVALRGYLTCSQVRCEPCRETKAKADAERKRKQEAERRRKESQTEDSEQRGIEEKSRK